MAGLADLPNQIARRSTRGQRDGWFDSWGAVSDPVLRRRCVKTSRRRARNNERTVRRGLGTPPSSYSAVAEGVGIAIATIVEKSKSDGGYESGTSSFVQRTRLLEMNITW